MGRNTSIPNYYPPRSRWYSGILSARDTWKRRLWLDRIHLPTGVSIGLFVVSMVIPGWGFRARGRRLFAGPIMAGCAVLALLFVAFLGRPVANLAFGLLLATHTVSLYYLVSPILMDARYRFRLFFMLILLLMMGCAIYMPIRDFVQDNWLMPLTYNGKVIVINRKASLRNLQVGDVVAYTIPGTGWAHEGVIVREGYGLGPILACARDRVVFTPQNLLVNGVAQPLRQQMPPEGDFVVGENYWFIWPELGTHNRGHVAASSISGAILQMAQVPQSRLLGRPFAHWFGHRQLPL